MSDDNRRELASLLLAWSASLEERRITFEQWQDEREERIEATELAA